MGTETSVAQNITKRNKATSSPTTTAMPSSKPPTPWEIAKPILEKDILSGRVTEDMYPRHVVALRPFIYGEVRNFGSNYRALQKTIKKWKDEAEEDRLLLEHDKQLYTFAKDDPSCWHGSDAQKLLPGDLDTYIGIETGKLLPEWTPKKIRLTRDEYQVFTLKKFSGHIHQELRKRKETPYWTYKMKKKELKKKKAAGENVEDLFYDPVLEL